MTPPETPALPPTAEPAPPAPRTQFRSRPRDDERLTRKPLDLWDRIKLILLFLFSWLVLFWATLAQFDPKISTREAFNQTVRGYWWLLVLAGLEIIRQLHYLISEHWGRYHRRWTGLFSGAERRTGRMNDWTRYRISRVLKLLFVLVIIDLLLAKIYHLPPATALIQLPIAITKALPVAFQFAFGFFFVMIQFIGLFWFLSKGGVDTYFPDDIKTRFSDVKGQDAVLGKVMENMVFIEDPESIEQKGGYVPGGILLWGPPGTGKTLMAQAVAGETAKPFVFVEPGAFLNMFIGVGVLKVKSLYRKLRKLALRYGGVIVFFDEADALGNRGSMGGGPWNADASGAWTTGAACNGMSYLSRPSVAILLQDALSANPSPPQRPSKHGIIAGMGGMGGGMGTLQSLLAEMSGLKKPRGFFNRIIRRALGLRPKPPPKYRILHIFATNRPDVLDEAMLRPGRIDRIYKVGYPSKEGRMATYEYYLGKVKHALTPEQIDRLATVTPYATGASIQDMVNEALVIAIRDGREVITWKDINKAKQLKQHGLPDDFKYIERERHAIAVHEACHAVAAYRVQRHLVIDVATIERRGDIGGFVAPIPVEDVFVEWKSEQDADLMVSLASLAGERMFFEGDSSTGVTGDLRNATGLATRMEAYWGMGSTIGSHAVTKLSAGGARPYTGEDGQDRMLLETGLGKRVEERLQEVYGRTWGLLETNRREVLCVAHALESEMTVSGDDIIAVIEGRQGPLIDGRPYHEPEFMAAIEAYHDQAVLAQHEHDKVNAPLPLLAPAVGSHAGGNGEVPGRPDVSGNGEQRHGAPVAEGDGAGSVEAGAGAALGEVSSEEDGQAES